jgi:DNA (cytosine-5)-methyltransferase 1
LGTNHGDSTLYRNLDKLIANNDKWILIGGPPCQAYSVVGESENKGNNNYDPSKDRRHFLYIEYLKVLEKYRPNSFHNGKCKRNAFSKIDGSYIASSILNDLSKGGLSNENSKDFGYKIFSLVEPAALKMGCIFQK